MTKGTFVISLDMELYWGMRDRRSLDSYRERILGVRQALPRMLEAFDRHGVKATFATVGLLFFGEREDLIAGLPLERPSYDRPALSPYNGHIDTIGADEDSDPFHFGSRLVQLVLDHPGHEIACHTFSHYYCLERGQTEAQFVADLRAARAVAQRKGIVLKSFVFPRNQYNQQYLACCAREGILAYRGNERSWLYAARDRESESRLRRALRLLDTWIPLTGANTHPLPDPASGLPYDLPSSRFLRPWTPRYSVLEGLKRKRITGAMDNAARRGELFHLWWHPHNFGKHLEENMATLHHILAHYAALHQAGRMENRTMGDLAEQIRAGHG